MIIRGLAPPAPRPCLAGGRSFAHQTRALWCVADLPATLGQLLAQVVGPLEVALGARILALCGQLLQLLGCLVARVLQQALEGECVQHLPEPSRAEPLAGVDAAVGPG